jgi:hypothetical protein
MTEISQPAQRSGLAAGIIAGLVAAIVGAGLYALFIRITEWEMTLATIAIGLLVGVAMMAVRPASPALPALAAIIALLGAAAGTIAGYVAVTVKVVEAAGRSVTYGQAFQFVTDNISEVVQIRTILYWAVGAVVAFTFVSRRVRAARPQLPVTDPSAAPTPPGSLFQPQPQSQPQPMPQQDHTNP